MSYDDTLPTSMDRARSLLGDVSNDSATELVTDDYITRCLSLYGNFNSAVAFMATSLAARFAQKPSNVSLPGGLGVTWGERIKYWSELAKQMRAGGVTLGAGSAFSVASPRTDGYSAYAEEQGE